MNPDHGIDWWERQDEDDRWIRKVQEEEEQAHIEQMQADFLKAFNEIFGSKEDDG